MFHYLDFLIKIGVGRVSALTMRYGESAVEWPIANTLIGLVEREGLKPSTPHYDRSARAARRFIEWTIALGE